MQPFFIVGAPRSGTTLLQAMLNRHPSIAVPPESKVYCDFDGCAQVQRIKYLTRLRADFDLPSHWQVPTSTSELLRSIQANFVKRVHRQDVAWIGDKTPEHTSKLLQIRRDFPESPIIALVRNGFHVAASLTRVPWIRCGLGSGAIIWSYYTRHISRFAESHPKRLLIVSYEQLCRNPVSILNQVFAFLKVDSNCSEFCTLPNADRDRFLFPPRELAWKSRALQPVTFSKPVHRDRRKQVRVACESMLTRWGHLDELEEPISSSERLYWNALNAMECCRAIASLPRGRLFCEVSGLFRSQFLKSPRSRLELVSDVAINAENAN